VEVAGAEEEGVVNDVGDVVDGAHAEAGDAVVVDDSHTGLAEAKNYKGGTAAAVADTHTH
jgi:hypothetical protein